MTSEPIDYSKDELGRRKHPDDLLSRMTAVGGINCKSLFFLFLIFVFLTSSIFVDRALSHISGAVENREPTGKGAIIQGLLLILFYAGIDAAIRHGYL